MAGRRIIKIGDPILREICQPIKKITPQVLKLLDDLADTLYAGPNRAGLAAPQVGIAKRLAVLDCGDGLTELINPQIIKKSGEQTGQEACLSMPGLVGEVKRADYVMVKTLDRSGKERTLEAKGFLAVCLQHEIEHLDGVLFIDHVPAGKLFHELTEEPLDVLQVIQFSKKNL
ncbi:peptide deformylase [Candidatus Formimonas warabiya]|uniref:Peptide deformylase n=1 Tax=Formimonas warabiya TaxID=1761012 RepID=A0A3G1KVR9_FORW1|nr:peptide deformylase [Candidatus Formimonas warabiya]ATW26542.1 peptide deformylase [Candidatus Formimonas warabiya]